MTMVLMFRSRFSEIAFWSVLIWNVSLVSGLMMACPENCVCSGTAVKCILLNQIPDISGIATHFNFDCLGRRTLEEFSGFSRDPSKLQSMTLRNCSITRFRSNALSDLRRLETLFIVGNNLDTITPKMFSTGNMSSLRHLDLSLNGIRQLSEGAFYGLLKMTHLILHSNKIESLTYEALKDAVGLGILDLSNNQIVKLEDRTFSSFLKLTELNLADNRISSISPSTFGGLLSLQKLTLSRNLLTTLPSGAFSPLSSLQYLDVKENTLESIKRDAFGDCRRMTISILSNNRLSNIEEGAFKKCAFVTSLFIDGNSLTDTTALRELTGLRFLNISNNRLSRLGPSIGRSSSLRVVRAASNKIQNISKEDIPENLGTLQLANNQISFLPGGILEGIRELDLENNSLTSLGSAVLSNCTFASVNLQGNPLESISADSLRNVSLQVVTFKGSRFTHLPSTWCPKTLLRISDHRFVFYMSSLSKCSSTYSVDIFETLTNHTDFSWAKMRNWRVLEVSGVTEDSVPNPLPSGIKTLSITSMRSSLKLSRFYIYKRALTHLNLTDARLVDYEFLRSAFIQILVLDGNDMAEIQDQASGFWPKVSGTLSIARCNIEEITSSMASGLLAMPETIILADNNIRELGRPFMITPLMRVRNLDLSGNLLTTIPDRAFARLKGLVSLNLANNMISTVGLHILNPSTLGNLMSLDLSHNHLEILDKESFEPLLHATRKKSSAKTINIEGNPLACDCRMDWVAKSVLRYWLDPEGSRMFDGTCMQPEKRNIQYSTEEDLKCFGPLIKTIFKTDELSTGHVLVTCVVQGSPTANAYWATPSGKLLNEAVAHPGTITTYNTVYLTKDMLDSVNYITCAARNSLENFTSAVFYLNGTGHTDSSRNTSEGPKVDPVVNSGDGQVFYLKHILIAVLGTLLGATLIFGLILTAFVIRSRRKNKLFFSDLYAMQSNNSTTLENAAVGEASSTFHTNGHIPSNGSRSPPRSRSADQVSPVPNGHVDPYIPMSNGSRSDLASVSLTDEDGYSGAEAKEVYEQADGYSAPSHEDHYEELPDRLYTRSPHVRNRDSTEEPQIYQNVDIGYTSLASEGRNSIQPTIYTHLSDGSVA